MFKWVVLTATIIFWGLAFTAIKYAVAFISPISIATLRFAVADTLFLLSILSGRRVQSRDLPMTLVLGVFGVSVYHICLNIGEIYVSSGVASLIISLAPVFVLILSWMFLNERITALKIIGTGVAFAGVALISKPSSGNIFGILIVLASAIAAAIYTTLGKKLMEKYDAVTLTSYTMLLGSIPLIPFLPSSLAEILSNPNTITSILFLGFFSTYLGYMGWYYFLEREEASKASIFLLTIPVVSLIAGSLLLDEELTVLTFAGAMTILLGVYMVLKG